MKRLSADGTVYQVDYHLQLKVTSEKNITYPSLCASEYMKVSHLSHHNYKTHQDQSHSFLTMTVETLVILKQYLMTENGI